MRIALLGYGKMGREIEKMAMERGHEISLILDRPEEWEENSDRLKEVDIAIDFSTPESIVDNIHHCFDASVPMVIGTTGWHTHIPQIREECIDRGCSLFFSPNFSIGVNIFFELNRFLATLMSEWAGYEISLEETHHIHKKDTPSGTAIILANDIISLLGRKEKWVKETPESSADLGIRSVRMEDITGTHKVIYESDEDVIEIEHIAKTRRGFALGAVMAAEWLPGKKGFFEMEDLFRSLKKKS